ncbi:hypothetical protein BCR34DRAFT_556404 [Clohesyomyces aquaticus]|uniref:EthD domain-containing protein n=1 Tax=Clohesyomyces aquaticus TaxID=1231657 RepID=A0A1Y2A3G8_9PLEO|nr:hypothetical protein BCR34DRAFT_556404 [Clohesyomyces aquaticus]
MGHKTAIVVAYPSTHPSTKEPLKFDMSYYLSGHMPMIERAWGPYGMKSWSINTFPAPCPLTGETPPYLVQTTCFFGSVEDFKVALEKGGEETKKDVERFSNVFPVIWVGDGGASGRVGGLEGEGIPQA